MKTEFAIQLTVIVLFEVLIIIGNSSLIVCICITRQLHNPSSYIVMSLATADLLVGAWLLPFSIPAVISQEWTAGSAMCQVNGFTNHLLSCASILGLFIISLDRYISIFYPLRYQDYMTTKRALILISCTWGYALLTAIFPLIGWSQYVFAKGIWLCVTDFKASYTFSYFITFSVYGIPLTFMTIIYFRIFKIAFHHAKAIEQQAFVNERPNELPNYPTLNKWLETTTAPLQEISSETFKTKTSSKNPGNTAGMSCKLHSNTKSLRHTNKSTENHLRVRADSIVSSASSNYSRRQLTKQKKKGLRKIKKEIRTGLVLSVIVIIFVISWSPFAILNLWALHSGKKTSLVSEAVVSRLAYANSAINPPLYCLMNKVIRKSMHKLWYRIFILFKLDLCFKCKKPEDNEITTFENTNY